MRYVAYGFWLLVVLVGIVFASLNSKTVDINFYVARYHVYLPLLMLIELALGAVLGVLAGLPWLFRAKRQTRKLKLRIKEIEQEVNNLRAIPIKDTH